MNTLRKSTLVLALALLTTGIGNGIAQTMPIPPSQFSPGVVNPDDGPNPNCIPGVTCGSTGN
jgi:hypothetical protein